MPRLSASTIAVVFVAAFTTIACSSSDKAPVQADDTLAGALTKGVKFKDGLIKKGPIGEAGKSARDVKLTSLAKALAFEPGGNELMSFDASAPGQGDSDGNAVAATLMQFEDASDHIEVPVMRKGTPDGGSQQGDAVRIENPFTVDDGICKSLCNRRFMSVMSFAVVLDDGSISEQSQRDVVLDCTHDGDPKRCKANEPSGSGADDDGGKQRDASAAVDSGKTEVGDAGVTPAADAGRMQDAGPPGMRPQIGPIAPVNTAAAMDVALAISGTGFVQQTVVYIDGKEVPTKFASDTQIDAMVGADATAEAGSLAVYVENVPGDESTRSNTLYLQVDPAPGAPLLYDYSPDNGVARDTILIIASNLAGQTLEITDAKGNTLKPGAIGTISWPTAGSVDTVEVVLPDSIATGPITISNGLGSFKGKIFNVGDNLTRIDGTTLASSSQYNTGMWGTASGGDNRLATSFFTASGDCATATSCTMKPWYEITFPSKQTVTSIAMRGNREYASGYDFLRGTFEVLDANDDVLWEGTYDLPAPDRDLDVVLPMPVKNAIAVRFSSLEDESVEPGFAELEVF